MTNTTPSISIGIAAYNEEANIKNLLESLLAQKQDGFLLEEIIVVSDGGEDNTGREVLSVNDPRIKLIEHEERRGQAEAQNEILGLFKGDIVVILNADILPTDNEFIKHLIQPLLQESHVGVVGCSSIPLPAQNFFEKVLNYSMAMKDEMAQRWDSGNNIYMCHGHARAMPRDFAKQFKWLGAYAEDAYSYLECIKDGYKFRYAKHAAVLFRSPQNFKDHRWQSIRFAHGIEQLYNYFPKKVVDKAHLIPAPILRKAALKYFFKHPLLFTSYVVIFVISFVSSKFSAKMGLTWKPSPTTKKLIQ